MQLLLLLIGLVILVLGAELLVRGAVGVAARLKVTPLVIGLTVVAFGGRVVFFLMEEEPISRICRSFSSSTLSSDILTSTSWTAL